MSAPIGSIKQICKNLLSEYQKATPARAKIIDLFLVAIVAVGVVQFIYCQLVGTFPFNSFLSGFICAVGLFVLIVGLRLHITTPDLMSKRSEYRAFADFVICGVILFLFVMNFIG